MGVTQSGPVTPLFLGSSDADPAEFTRLDNSAELTQNFARVRTKGGTLAQRCRTRLSGSDRAAISVITALADFIPSLDGPAVGVGPGGDGVRVRLISSSARVLIRHPLRQLVSVCVIVCV